MWSEGPGIAKVLFNTYKDAINGKYNAFIQQKNILINESFINNNTFSGCLHSKGVVLYAHLSLPENMLIYQPPR